LVRSLAHRLLDPGGDRGVRVLKPAELAGRQHEHPHVRGGGDAGGAPAPGDDCDLAEKSPGPSAPIAVPPDVTSAVPSSSTKNE
jgi:hypothetical protein